MTTVWFTADPHFGHAKIAEIRGFDSLQEHDQTIIDNLDRQVGKRDTLWILGDISSGASLGQKTALETLKATFTDTERNIHCITGNHDGAHPMHRNYLRWDKAYREVFESVSPFGRRKIDGHNVWLSHFPWNGGGDHTTTDRYSSVRLNDNGVDWIIHGHNHSSEKANRQLRQIHVGLDAWGLKAASINDIADIIRSDN